MARKKSYVDIGHSDLDNVFVWLYESSLVVVPAESGTHEQIWGQNALKYWRGRYDGKTNELSMIPPVTWPEYFGVPDEVMEGLVNRFGEFDLAEFNPKGSPRKRKRRKR